MFPHIKYKYYKSYSFTSQLSIPKPFSTSIPSGIPSKVARIGTVTPPCVTNSTVLSLYSSCILFKNPCTLSNNSDVLSALS